MIFKYLTFSFSIAFISFMVGMILGAGLRKTAFYERRLTNLNFMRSEKWNKLMGVFMVRWIIKNTFFKYLNQKLTAKPKIEKSDLLTLRSEMTMSEIDHLIGFLFVTIFAVMKFYHGYILFGLIIMAVNILMNLNPSLLQQENKRRIDRLLKMFV